MAARFKAIPRLIERMVLAYNTWLQIRNNVGVAKDVLSMGVWGGHLNTLYIDNPDLSPGGIRLRTTNAAGELWPRVFIPGGANVPNMIISIAVVTMTNGGDPAITSSTINTSLCDDSGLAVIAPTFALEHRLTPGFGFVAANGIGVRQEFWVEDASANREMVGNIDVVNTVAAHATQAAQMRLSVLGTDILTIEKNNGEMRTGFFGKTPVAKPTGVAVTAAGIHAALVTLGLIAA